MLGDKNTNAEFADFARQLLAFQRQLNEQMRPVLAKQEGLQKQAEVAKKIARTFEKQSQIGSTLRYISEAMASFQVPVEAIRAMNSLTLPDYVRQLSVQQREINSTIQHVLERARNVWSVEPPDLYIKSFLEHLQTAERPQGDKGEVTATEAVVRAHTEAAAKAGIGPFALLEFLITIVALLAALYAIRISSEEHEDLSAQLERTQEEILSKAESIRNEILEELRLHHEGPELVALDDINLYSQPDSLSPVICSVEARGWLLLLEWGPEWTLVRVELSDRSITGWVKSGSMAFEGKHE